LFGSSFATAARCELPSSALTSSNDSTFADVRDSSEVNRMKDSQLPKLRAISLFFLLPGLAGLVLSAILSAHYLSVLPTVPVPEEMRMIPRSIEGTVVYQTEREDRILDLAEGTSVGFFLVGFIVGIVYLEKHSSMLARRAEIAGQKAERAG
jgi:hypothetical protein